MRWIVPATVAIALLVLGWCNLNFYFHRYYADPESLKSECVQVCPTELRGANCSEPLLGIALVRNYEVFTVGQSPWPYDPVTTRYLVREQKWTLLTNPATELASITRDNKGVAFLFFPGNEQYEQNDT